MLKNLFRFISGKFQTLHFDYPVEFKPRFGHGTPPHPELYKLIAQRDKDYQSLLITCNELAIEHLTGIESSQDDNAPMKPYWKNDFLPGLDIVSLFGILGIYQPKKYIEIGSGNSTMVARHAIDKLALPTRIISIDPVPRAGIDQISDEVCRVKFEDFSLKRDLSAELEAGDILFIDNSHRSLPNSDVTACFLELIPRLKPGVIVQVHDVYLPNDYPQFMCDRGYSEQYLLGVMLLSNPKRFKVLLPNFYVSEHHELRSILDSFWDKLNYKKVERHGGSFWFVT